MHRAASACSTCGACASASEYTATVAIPSSRQARITRMAISPRLAMRTRENIGMDLTPSRQAAKCAKRPCSRGPCGRSSSFPSSRGSCGRPAPAPRSGDKPRGYVARSGDKPRGYVARSGDKPRGYVGGRGRRSMVASARRQPHILKTPGLVSGTGALRAAASARPRTSRVSIGSSMPSSHRRAVE